MKTTQVTPYSALPNSTVQAADGISYAYRDTGGEEESVPLVLLQHFRGNLDYWDPALVDALAQSHRVITFDNAGVGNSTGTTPDTIEQMARDAIAFISALGPAQADPLGFSIGSFVAREIALRRPGLVRRLILASSAPKSAPRMYGSAPAALGFELQFEFEPPGGSPATMLHTPDGARVELFEVPEASNGEAPGTAMLPRVGHVAFEVDDLGAVLAAATAAGGTEVSGPRPAPAPGRRMAFVSDIDGNLLELIGPVEEPGHGLRPLGKEPSETDGDRAHIGSSEGEGESVTENRLDGQDRRAGRR